MGAHKVRADTDFWLVLLDKSLELSCSALVINHFTGGGQLRLFAQEIGKLKEVGKPAVEKHIAMAHGHAIFYLDDGILFFQLCLYSFAQTVVAFTSGKD